MENKIAVLSPGLYRAQILMCSRSRFYYHPSQDRANIWVHLVGFSTLPVSQICLSYKYKSLSIYFSFTHLSVPLFFCFVLFFLLSWYKRASKCLTQHFLFIKIKSIYISIVHLWKFWSFFLLLILFLKQFCFHSAIFSIIFTRGGLTTKHVFPLGI